MRPGSPRSGRRRRRAGVRSAAQSVRWARGEAPCWGADAVLCVGVAVGVRGREQQEGSRRAAQFTLMRAGAGGPISARGPGAARHQRSLLLAGLGSNIDGLPKIGAALHARSSVLLSHQTDDDALRRSQRPPPRRLLVGCRLLSVRGERSVARRRRRRRRRRCSCSCSCRARRSACRRAPARLPALAKVAASEAPPASRCVVNCCR